MWDKPSDEWLEVQPCQRQVCRDARQCRCDEFGLHRRVDRYERYTVAGVVRWARSGRRASRRRVSAARRRQVIARDGGACLRCRSTVELEADHIVPVSRGGTNDMDNLQTLCAECNRRKGQKV